MLIINNDNSMRRYFYNDIGIISKWLEKNAFAKSYQDSVYRNALLSAIRQSPQQSMDTLREVIINMTISQQQKYANNYHLQALFNNFHHLHKYSRGREMIFDGSSSQANTALVDPDKFPIWDLKKYSSIYQSLWGHHLAQLRYDLGFQVIIRESQIQHVAGGKGTYIILPQNKQKISVGSFIGLVPGKVYNNFNDFKGIALSEKKQYHRNPQHIHFPSGKILQLGNLSVNRKEEYGLDTNNKGEKVDATFHNPYAFGHMINHPPPGYQPNVVFGQINISRLYFPKFLLKYLPYQDYTDDKKEVTLFGVFSIKEIEHKQQLFVNYNQSHIYPIDNIPEWLIEPPQFSPIFKYLKKGEYELPQSGFWKAVEKRALEKNKQLFQKYQKQTIYRPDTLQFEDSFRRYKKMKIRLEDDNQYEHL